MARKPIQIDVASDTRAFSKGVKSGVIDPLEDVEQAMQDVARESERAGDDISDSFKDAGRDVDDFGDDSKKAFKKVEDASEDAMRDAQADTEKLQKEHKQLHDVIEKGSRSSFRKMEANSEKASRSARDDVGEFKDEAKQNFSEVASSFTGDMDGAVDLVQGTLGGLASSIPGYGLALGALGAAAGVFYSQWRENTEKTKQRVADMYDDMLESGESYLSESYQQEQYWSILKDESEIISLDKTKEYARKAGVSYQTVALAWAGNHEAMRLVQEGLYEEREELQEKNKNLSSEEAAAMGSQVSWLDNIIRKTEARAGEIDATIERVNEERTAFELMTTSANTGLRETGEKIAAAKSRMAELTQESKDAKSVIDGMPHNINLKINVDDSDAKRKIDRLTARRYLQVVPNYVERNGSRIY